MFCSPKRVNPTGFLFSLSNIWPSQEKMVSAAVFGPWIKCTLALSRSTVDRCIGRHKDRLSADSRPQSVDGGPTVGILLDDESTDGRSTVGGWTFTRQQEQEKQATNTITHFKEHFKVLKSTWLYTRAWIFMMLTRSMNVHVKQKTDHRNAAEK